jgi:hypothetical protein
MVKKRRRDWSPAVFASLETAPSATPLWCKIISPRYPHTRHISFVEGTECHESCLWRLLAQDLVQWSHLPASEATWEDREALQQQFPCAPAWGQAGLQEGGIVNGLSRPAVDQNLAGEDQVKGPLEEKTTGRPTRSRKIPSRLMGY